MLKSLAMANYRSIRDLVLPLGSLNLVTGPNGSGKSNLYRAGQTKVVNQGDLETPPWHWASRWLAHEPNPM
jgi:predicted ATP-dependent endonuclease of OLD family